MVKFQNVIENCIDCGGCFVICKSQNEVPPGTARVRVVTYYEGVEGEENVAVSCMHCSEPVCVDVCPVTAITKRPDGIVLGDKTKCIGCGFCGLACPFAVPQYPEGLQGDLAEWNRKMDKCTACVQPFVPVAEDRDPKARCALFCSTKCRTFV
jgi:formate dehydrogenase iron-sulfur subunit